MPTGERNNQFHIDPARHGDRVLQQKEMHFAARQRCARRAQKARTICRIVRAQPAVVDAAAASAAAAAAAVVVVVVVDRSTRGCDCFSRPNSTAANLLAGERAVRPDTPRWSERREGGRLSHSRPYYCSRCCPHEGARKQPLPPLGDAISIFCVLNLARSRPGVVLCPAQSIIAQHIDFNPTAHSIELSPVRPPYCSPNSNELD